jgi:recombination protein RecA
MSNWMSKLSNDFGVLVDSLKKDAPKPVPLPSPSLNWATTIGGFQPGKIHIMFGAESSGKSAIAMMAVAEMQRRDPEAIAIWFDAEFSFSPDLFELLGGDSKRIRVKKTNDPLQIFDFIAKDLLEVLQEGAPIKAIIIDSIKAIRYPKDHKKQSTDQTMGGSGAPYLPSAIKMILPVITEYGLMTCFIQQVSMQLDPMKAMRNPYILPDGNALKHAADLMLEVSKLDTKAGTIEGGVTIAGGTAQVGHKIRVKVKKNRLGAPARVAQFDFSYEKGVINQAQEIFELGKALGIIYHPVNMLTGRANNQMWQFGNHPALRGEDNTKNWVIENKNIQDEILAACYGYKDNAANVDASGFVSEDSDVELS